MRNVTIGLYETLAFFNAVLTYHYVLGTFTGDTKWRRFPPKSGFGWFLLWRGPRRVNRSRSTSTIGGACSCFRPYAPTAGPSDHGAPLTCLCVSLAPAMWLRAAQNMSWLGTDPMSFEGPRGDDWRASLPLPPGGKALSTRDVWQANCDRKGRILEQKTVHRENEIAVFNMMMPSCACSGSGLSRMAIIAG